MTEETTIWLKLKILAGIEVVGFLISLAIPVTPSRTGRPFHWPASWTEYFDRVAFAFVLANILFAVIFVAGWIYLKFHQGPESEEQGSSLDRGGGNSVRDERSSASSNLKSDVSELASRGDSGRLGDYGSFGSDKGSPSSER